MLFARSYRMLPSGFVLTSFCAHQFHAKHCPNDFHGSQPSVRPPSNAPRRIVPPADPLAAAVAGAADAEAGAAVAGAADAGADVATGVAELLHAAAMREMVPRPATLST